MRYVYLAGPVEQCTPDEIETWRERANSLFVDGIVGIFPTRGDSKAKNQFETAKRIVSKNYMDVSMCDIILAHMPKEINERRPSYGTTFEIAWGYSMQKPVVIVSDDSSMLTHPLMLIAGIHFTKLDDAVDHINILLGDYI